MKNYQISTNRWKAHDNKEHASLWKTDNLKYWSLGTCGLSAIANNGPRIKVNPIEVHDVLQLQDKKSSIMSDQRKKVALWELATFYLI